MDLNFSIITVCYNSSKTIEKTIKSILGQTCQDYEYIIVDGASKDNTLDIIKRYEPLFGGRMKWISEPDSGIYNAMNKGIKMSTGELIGIVNSDDWLEPTALESIKNLAEVNENRSKAIFCGSLKFHYQDGSVQLMESDQSRFNKGMKEGNLNHGAFHPSMFVGTNVYKSYGLYDEHFKVIADGDFIYRCYRSGIKFYFTKAVISNMSDGGASNKMNLKRRIPDKIYACKKNGAGKLKTSCVVCKYIITLVIKHFIPESLIRVYRTKKSRLL